MLGKSASLIEALRSAREIAEIRRVAADALPHYRIDGLMCLPLFPRWKQSGLVVLRDSWPYGWVETYNEREYHYSDPAVKLAERTARPFTTIRAPIAPADTRGREIQDERRRAGLKAEIAFPVHINERLHGIVFMIQGHNADNGITYGDLAIFCAALIEVLQEALHPGRNPLTKRELEMLHWASLGKTTDEIAAIVGLTPRTVNTHFENAARKLGTGNRLHTVVQAIKLKLMD